MTRTGISAERLELARQLREAGMSWEGIGRELAVDPTTIRRKIDERAAKVVEAYNRRRRKTESPEPVSVKRGHQFPWEGSD